MARRRRRGPDAFGTVIAAFLMAAFYAVALAVQAVFGFFNGLHHGLTSKDEGGSTSPTRGGRPRTRFVTPAQARAALGEVLPTTPPPLLPLPAAELETLPPPVIGAPVALAEALPAISPPCPPLPQAELRTLSPPILDVGEDGLPAVRLERPMKASEWFARTDPENFAHLRRGTATEEKRLCIGPAQAEETTFERES